MRALVAALIGATTAIAAGASTGAPAPQTIVFVRGERVFLMRADGSEQRPAPFPAYPTYAPDGRRVLFAVYSRKKNGQALVVANADGRARRRVTGYYYCFRFAEWSPGATKIAYTHDCDVDFMSIYVVDRDGRHRRQLTGRWNLDPHWSPDGRTILLTSYTRQRSWRLYLMDANGRHRREIRGAYPVASDAFYRATWSRDGRRIYFLIWATKELYVMNRDGTGVRNLTPEGLSIGAYALSPDERSIVVHGVTHSGAARDIFVFEPGGGARRLTDARGADEAPAWSPDGAKIAFASERDGNAEIYVMNPDGTEQTNISRNPAADGVPSWVPRGRS